MQYWNSFDQAYRAFDGCPFSFWVYGRMRNDEVITRGELSRADWWSTRAFYSELVSAPLPMKTIGPGEAVKQSIDLAPILESAYEHKLKKKMPPDALHELREVGVRCRIFRSPDFRDQIEVQKQWTLRER